MAVCQLPREESIIVDGMIDLRTIRVLSSVGQAVAFDLARGVERPRMMYPQVVFVPLAACNDRSVRPLVASVGGQAAGP